MSGSVDTLMVHPGQEILYMMYHDVFVFHISPGLHHFNGCLGPTYLAVPPAKQVSRASQWRELPRASVSWSHPNRAARNAELSYPSDLHQSQTKSSAVALPLAMLQATVT